MKGGGLLRKAVEARASVGTASLGNRMVPGIGTGSCCPDLDGSQVTTPPLEPHRSRPCGDKGVQLALILEEAVNRHHGERQFGLMLSAQAAL